MVNALLVGNGAREHALAAALVRGGAEIKAFMNKKNPGIVHLAKEYRVDSLENFEHACAFGKDCDFAVIGPEAPLVVGIANALESAGIPCVGPRIDAAQLEGSKIFTRELLDTYKVPGNIAFSTFTGMDGILDYVRELGLENVVVKPDGLTGGKGVKVAGEHLHSEADVLAYAKEIVDGRGRVVIEEKLDGEEFTLQTLVDGETILPTPIVQDHKRAFENDEGPNTGGMGSYSMADHLMPFISKDDITDALACMKGTIDALKRETGTAYKGFLYGQFMKTRNGVRLVEYNVRFGDPEAMNVLSIMTSNFVEACKGVVDGNLHKLALEHEPVATVVKYLVPAGYPDTPAVNEPIVVDTARLEAAGASHYFASVNQLENGAIVTSSSRTLGVLGKGSTLDEAERIAEAGVAAVSGRLFHRADIGTAVLLQKRIEHMKRLGLA